MHVLKPGEPLAKATGPVAPPSATEAGDDGPCAAYRAAVELRRGAPVLVSGAAPLILLAVETACEAGLTQFDAMTTGAPVVLLAPSRAASVLHHSVEGTGPVAFRLAAGERDAARLRALADPTADQALLPAVEKSERAPALAEAALALAKLARLLPAVIAATPTADALADRVRSGLVAVTPEGALQACGADAPELYRVAEASVPLLEAPDARIVAFRVPASGIEHLAILIGQPERAEAPLVRVHSECFTGDLLGSLRCDCGAQLRGAISRMAAEGAGVLVYLAQEGRGIGLVNKLRAYALQDGGLDTVDANEALGWNADERDFGIAAAMLTSLGIRRLRLLTNNPEKVAALTAHGLDVVKREQHAFAANGVNDAYLAAKVQRFGHLME